MNTSVQYWVEVHAKVKQMRELGEHEMYGITDGQRILFTSIKKLEIAKRVVLDKRLKWMTLDMSKRKVIG